MKMRQTLLGADVRRRLCVGALWLLVLPAAALAQEQEQAQECQLTGSRTTNDGAAALQRAQAAESPEDAERGYAEALAALEPWLDTDDPAVFLLAANAQIGLKDYLAAHGLLNKFIEIAPECGQVASDTRYNAWVNIYNEAIEAYQGGDTEGALGHFELANIVYEDIRAFNNTALLYLEQGNEEKAIEIYRAGLDAGGEQDQVRQALTGLGDLLLANGRQEEAASAFESYLAQFPEDVAVRVNYAIALSDTGQGEEASAIFADVMSRTDLDAELWVQVGVGLYNSGDYARATEAFANARAQNPYNKEAMENYVNASVQADDASDPILALADTLITWYPYDAANYQLYASAVAQNNDDRQAMQILQDGENTEIVFHAVQIAEVEEGSYVVRGVLEARAAGGAIQIPFEFIGADGQVIATEMLSRPAPAPESRERFELNVTVSEPIMGFRYRKSGS
jgi:tetratricopeptide (TPR) repeat protein